MRLHGQGGPARRGGNARGYAMAALLVGMSVMAVLMGAALPVWNKQAQREREEEYLFRATEYARAIQKFQRRAGPGTLPPTFDVLVEGRFLRRKYKDPITGGDFQPVYQTSAPVTQPGGNATPGGLVGTTPTSQTGGTSTSQSGGTPTAGTGAPSGVSKKIPLTTALAPAVRVIWNFTCPAMFHTRYWPPENPVAVRVSSVAPLTASSTSIVSMRPRLSQSST